MILLPQTLDCWDFRKLVCQKAKINKSGCHYITVISLNWIASCPPVSLLVSIAFSYWDIISMASLPPPHFYFSYCPIVGTGSLRRWLYFWGWDWNILCGMLGKGARKELRMMGKAGCGGSDGNSSTTGTLRQEHCCQFEVILGYIAPGQPGLQSIKKG